MTNKFEELNEILIKKNIFKNDHYYIKFINNMIECVLHDLL